MEKNVSVENIETIEMIAATIVHEVKNPLALIQAHIDLLQLQDKDKLYKKNYDIIQKEIRKANELLKDLMNIARFSYRFNEDVELYDVIKEQTDSFEEAYGAIDFRLYCPDKNLYFEGNRQLFSWVVSNVLKNAVEAMEGKGIVEISVTQEAEKAVVLIKDSGAGFSMEAEDKLKEGGSFTTKANGSGAGLPLCRNIIAEHGGTFIIENGKNPGAVVTITLPI